MDGVVVINCFPLVVCIISCMPDCLALNVFLCMKFLKFLFDFIIKNQIKKIYISNPTSHFVPVKPGSQRQVIRADVPAP